MRRRLIQMLRNVAVEGNLRPVSEFLSQKGYHVDSVSFDREFTREMEKYDAVVVTGLTKDFLGVQDTNTKALVIDAKGLTAEQVYNAIENGLR